MDIDSPLPVRKKIFTPGNIIGFIFTLALSAVFFYSAYSKIHNENAFDNFQWTFLDLGINSLLVAGIIARVMIGFEVMLGMFLLAHLFLTQFTYKAILVTLSLFIIYLLFVLLRQGNSGDCGCFGDKLAMTPLQAIIKNVAMMAVTILLMFIYRVQPYKHQDIVVTVVSISSIGLPFILNMINVGSAPIANKRAVDVNLLYKYSPAPPVDVRKGKHIVAFMSYTCPHCKKAAYLLQIIHREHPEYPILMVLDGAPEQKKQFFDETHAEHVPYIEYHHTDEFMEMAGPGVPAIYWINNGVAELKSEYAYYQLDPKYMGMWLNNQPILKGK